MSDLIDLLSIIFPLLSISFVLIITSINFYFKIRRKFPATVNCWFCNVNSRVKYDEKNSWTCPNCEQYNGFTEDGDYNRDIPAQRNSKLNIGSSISAAKRGKNNDTILTGGAASTATSLQSNGFCMPCNRNQEIKVQQLATFVPEYDDNYDEEIVEFTKKLEQAYRLCYRCERILNRTLNKVKHNILGSKLSQIGSMTGINGFNNMKMHNSSQVSSSAKRRVFARLCFYLLIIVAVMNLIQIGREIAIGKSQLDSVFPTQVTNAILMIISSISAIQHILGMAIESLINTKPIVICLEFLNNMLGIGYRTMATSLLYFAIGGDSYSFDLNGVSRVFKILQTDTSFMLDFSGMLLSIVVLMLNGLKRNGPVIVWLLWSFKMAMPSVESRKFINNDTAVSETLFSLINVTISTIVFIISLLNTRNMNPPKIACHDPNQSYHKIYTNEMNSDASDDSDDETDALSTSYSSQREFNYCASPNLTSSSPKASLHNGSMDTTKSFSPSLLRGQLNSSFDSSRYSVKSHHSQRNVFGGSQNNVFDDCQSTFSGYRSNGLRSQDSLYSPKISQISDKQFTSMDNIIGNDFQFGINGLNINGSNSIVRPQSSFTPQIASPTPSTQNQLRHRNNKQVLSPSRFNFNTTLLPTQQPLTQASWVAGGYWNGTSPQKKCSTLPPVLPPTIDLLPILSRTSSQSSGFESRASSVVNGGNGSGGDSEGSICGDAAEQASVFSDTIQASQYNQHGGGRGKILTNLNNSCSRSLFEQPRQLFPPSFSEKNYQRNNDATLSSMPNYFNQTLPATINPTVYHQFGTQRASPSSSFVSTTTNNIGGRHINNLNNQSAFTFNKLTNNLPVIEKGSLLRDWKQRSLIDVNNSQQ